MVSPNVVAARPERFGVNLDFPGYRPWMLNAGLFNNLTGDAGMEPVVLRFKGTVSGGDTSTIEDSALAAANAVGDGFFDGAQARVYRIINGAASLLRADRVARYTVGAGGTRIELAQVGPAVAAGDVYFLALVRADLEYAGSDTGQHNGADTWLVYPNWGDTSAISKEHDATTVPPGVAGRTSLRVRSRAAMDSGVLQFIAGEAGDGENNALRPGLRYRVDLWIKQEGIGDGAVNVWLAAYRARIGQTFKVTGEWARYGFSFRGPRWLSGKRLGQLNIAFRGPGTIWLDQVRIYAAGQPPYALDRRVKRALADFRPGMLRIWSGQTNIHWGTSLDSWIAPEEARLRQWGPRYGFEPGPLFGLAAALRCAREIGATPWLIVHISFDEDEWRNLIEYLAGPDTTPYGRRRAACGQERPWTDEFAQIRIEFGNETWNAMFEPWTFSSGKQYGQFAEYFIGVARSSPYFAAVADKISFMLNGWTLSSGPLGYGTRARHASPSATLIAMASYLSGWDREQLAAADQEEQFQNTLLYAPWVIHRLTDRQTGMRKLLARSGVAVTIATSEAGSEYTPPEPDQPTDMEQELFGKSLAAGVSLLDALLYEAASGYGPQAYHAFGVGPRWSSHTRLDDGFRPHPAWLALQLRNRYAEGDMVATVVSGGPRINLPEVQNSRYKVPAQPDTALIAAYTFHHAGRYAIFVLSRRLNEATPVTIKLPEAGRLATLYTLTGDPRENNIDELRIRVRERKIKDFGAEHSFVLPPGSVYLFVVDKV